MNEAALDLGPPERLHPLSLLASLSASLRGMWGLFAAGGYFAVQGRWATAAAMIGLFTAFSIGAAFIRWRKFAFRVGTREIQIDSGLFNRVHRSIPFDRIQDVTVEQGPVARIFGLARVSFETGATAATKDDDGSLAAIPLARAGEIHDLVRASRGLGPSAEIAVAEEVESEPVFAMDLRRLLLAGVFNFSLAVVGALVGASQTMGDVIGFDPFDQAFWGTILARDTPIAAYVRAHQLAVVILGALTLIAIGLGTGIVRTVLRDYGFRLDRRETGLRRRRGLITLTDVTLPLKRVQAAVIATGPVRARFGWSEIKLQSLAQDEGGKGDHVVAPLADAGEVNAVLAAVAYPEIGRPAWRRISLSYVWTLAVGLSPLILIAALQVAVFALLPSMMDEALGGPAGESMTPALITSAVIFGVLLLAIGLRWLDWRRYGYALDGDRLLVRSGWWRRRLRILPLKNIQSLDYRQSFVGRWFGIASLTIGVAGGGLASHGVKALPAETARQLRGLLLARYA